MERSSVNSYYKTEYGEMLWGKCEDVISLYFENATDTKINLLFTSPPFPLNRAKKYGNMSGNEYLEWITKLGPLFSKALAPDGSLVIELGNAWEQGKPIHSTLPIEALLELKKSGDFHLCQEFIYYNPAKLPSPIEWVNKRRIRVKDSFTRIWWLSNSDYPKADNSNVKEAYSDQMKKLIKAGKYNSGKRPSEYTIGESSFLIDNGGAIPSNVLIAANTTSNDDYIKYCKENNLDIHPARMPKELAEFFIKFLTDEDDLVLDPFAGSNTTGATAEKLKRRWISIEASEEYIKGSLGRFPHAELI
jgi:DNA methylase N-4/N-6 domain-containing protein